MGGAGRLEVLLEPAARAYATAVQQAIAASNEELKRSGMRGHAGLHKLALPYALDDVARDDVCSGFLYCPWTVPPRQHGTQVTQIVAPICRIALKNPANPSHLRDLRPMPARGESRRDWRNCRRPAR